MVTNGAPNITESPSIEGRETLAQQQPSFLHVKVFLNPDFHLLGDNMKSFMSDISEASSMNVSETPIAVDQTNYINQNWRRGITDRDTGEEIIPRDENGTVLWNDYSWCHACVYNDTRDSKSVELSVFCRYPTDGNFNKKEYLKKIYSILKPKKMLIAENQAYDYAEFTEEEPRSANNIPAGEQDIKLKEEEEKFLYAKEAIYITDS
jgi:hypothetical protein